MQNLLNILLAIGVIGLIGLIVYKPNSKPTSPVLSNTQTESPTPMPTPNAKQYSKAEQVIKPGKSYTAILKTTAGEIVVELSNDTPVTTNNFVFLAKEKFYDGVIFHRTIPGFMIQGGDPTGTGSGGPGYRFEDEDFKGEYKRGVIAMANAGPNTNGSQFFIMHADYPLPPNYVIFGMVKSGLEAVDKIATAETLKDGRENSKPKTPVKIESIEILEK